MEAVNYLIVEIEQDYLNEINGVIVNSTIESVECIQRVATVVSAPLCTILKKGDKVVVHHNIFRKRNSTRGNVVESNYHIDNNLYFVPLTEVFMYKRGDKWTAIDPYCFVRPIEQVQREGFAVGVNEDSHKGMVQNIGIMEFPNKELLEQGVKQGDKVMFSRYSEYEFEIDGVLYYKMGTKDILGII